MSKNKINDEDMIEHRLSAILSEYNMLRNEILMYLGNHRRDTQIIAGVMGILVGLYVAGNSLIDRGLLVIIIPSSLFIYYLAQVMSHHMVSIEAKACARIERRINKLLKNKVMDWDSVVFKEHAQVPTSASLIALSAVLLFFIALFVVFSLLAIKFYGPISLIIHGIELAIMLVASVFMVLFDIKEKIPD